MWRNKLSWWYTWRGRRERLTSFHWDTRKFVTKFEFCFLETSFFFFFFFITSVISISQYYIFFLSLHFILFFGCAPARDRICAPALKAWSFNQWTAREVPRNNKFAWLVLTITFHYLSLLFSRSWLFVMFEKGMLVDRIWFLVCLLFYNAKRVVFRTAFECKCYGPPSCWCSQGKLSMVCVSIFSFPYDLIL